MKLLSFWAQRLFFAEMLLIFVFIFTINNYLGNSKTRINADGIGYYDYLPSIFIHNDFVKNNIPFYSDSIAFKRIDALDVYKSYDSTKLNKFSCGTALLQLPFFGYVHLTSTSEGSLEDGYQKPYQDAVFYAALFYLLLTMVFLRKLLLLYNVDKSVIFIIQFFLLFGTSVTHYANVDPAYSHVYSLFAITAFLYFVKSYFNTKSFNKFLLASAFLGLIFILRQINIVILFFIPFIAGSSGVLKEGVLFTLKHKIMIVTGFCIAMIFVVIQMYLWYLQTGHYLIYSYQGEGFNFGNPEFLNVLFSYRKGLFVYTPLLFICLLSSFHFVIKKQYFLFISWFSFFILLTYVISSWWAWWYGSSYGMRVYIDFYAVFFIPLALFLMNLKSFLKLLVLIPAFLTIPLNLIQSYQYKEFILDWTQMDKVKYWKVFLKTENKFKGYLFTEQINEGHFKTIAELSFGDLTLQENFSGEVVQISSQEIPDLKKVKFIKVIFENNFSMDSQARVVLTMNNAMGTKNYYWLSKPLLHFAQSFSVDWQEGFYIFPLKPFEDETEKVIALEFHNGKELLEIKNLRLKFLVLFNINVGFCILAQ
ncbi:MAG: hypothetical protein CVT92_15520 [Bacteroidetes bacterium HGW-Bacteroidetes-1]|jgi:hypothetical protein|nr:MAG: hypothetical protein CVT92_15520 [Bacteroidetes bacterium HGW-Bacteroidetes-1]